MRSAPEALLAAVAHDLPGAPSPPDEGWPLTSEVILAASQHRVLGLLWTAIEAGVARGDERLMDSAREAYLTGLRTSLVAEETAVRALDALGDAGLPVRALKGLAMAHLDHPDPSLRIFHDVDLLVRANDHVRAVEALTRVGMPRRAPAHWTWWERRFGKAIVMRRPGGAEVDLHLRLTGGYFGERIDHGRLWASPGDPFTLAGRTALGLPKEGRLLNACCHAVLGGGSGLRAIHDVATLALGDDQTWRATARSAGRDGVDLVVAEAIRRTWRDLSLDEAHPAARWARWHRPSPQQRAGLATYEPGARGGRPSEDRGVLDALPLAARGPYLVGLALPPQQTLRVRGRTYRSHLRRGARIVRGVQ